MTPGRCRCPLASRPSQPTALAGGAGGLGLHGRRGVPGPIPHPPASLSSASRLLSQVTVKDTSFVMLSPGPGRCSPAALAWSLAEGKRVQTVSLWKAGRISCRPQGNRVPSPDGIFSPQSWEGVYEQEAGGFHRSSQQHCPARSLNGRGCGFGKMSPLSCLVVEQVEKKSSGGHKPSASDGARTAPGWQPHPPAPGVTCFLCPQTSPCQLTPAASFRAWVKIPEKGLASPSRSRSRLITAALSSSENHSLAGGGILCPCPVQLRTCPWLGPKGTVPWYQWEIHPQVVG